MRICEEGQDETNASPDQGGLRQTACSLINQILSHSMKSAAWANQAFNINQKFVGAYVKSDLLLSFRCRPCSAISSNSALPVVGSVEIWLATSSMRVWASLIILSSCARGTVGSADNWFAASPGLSSLWPCASLGDMLQPVQKISRSSA